MDREISTRVPERKRKNKRVIKPSKVDCRADRGAGGRMGLPMVRSE